MDYENRECKCRPGSKRYIMKKHNTHNSQQRSFLFALCAFITVSMCLSTYFMDVNMKHESMRVRESGQWGNVGESNS